MKKQVFLLTLIAALFGSSNVLPVSSDCCAPVCSTDCNTSCDTSCTDDHGKTYRDIIPHFQGGSVEMVSMYSSNVLHNLNHEDKHGAFQVTVFGGKNTKRSDAAAYYLPYGHNTLTFDGAIAKPHTFAFNAAESVAQIQVATLTAQALNGHATDGTNFTASPSPVFVDPVNYQFDSNRDTSIVRPWNFGITFAALFEPGATSGVGAASGVGFEPAVGSGLITSPAFKSTINPCLSYSHVGAGFGLRYHFSDDKKGFFGTLTTAVQRVSSVISLNEVVETEKEVIGDYAAANPYGIVTPAGVTAGDTQAIPNKFGINDIVFDPNAHATVTPVGSIATAYAATSLFPGTGDVAAPANVTEAFCQNAWNYGKIAPCQKITRLADIELALGYQWWCGDCASTNWYVGVVIPTGNKVCAEFVAPAVVGNGFHAGLMTGSTTEVLLSDEENYQASYRLDMNARYLFKNTQKRSFDLLGNEWSRYMMVWENKAAYTAAVAAANAITAIAPVPATGSLFAGVAQRGYTPGINSFTADMSVKPRLQGRVNQALYIRGEHARLELGWNTFAKHKECVALACPWDNAPAFAESSYIGGVGLNNARTIYNDAQTMSYNVVDNLNRVFPITTPTALVTIGNNTLADTNYDDFAITEAQINLDSASSSATLTQTPYAVLGYAWESDFMPQFSIGGSYEFSSGNSALNQWLVFGKFEMAF
ncbi:MAG: hypothetical protein NTZ68_00780 [Candidatus Dependentiae bacterium]|nr:hypothetical protein [Candidatus Dependentiae bacterium]